MLEQTSNPRLMRTENATTSVEDLVRNWNLSGIEFDFIRRFNVEYRSWASFCLCTLRSQGRLPGKDEPISSQVATWLNKFLSLPLHKEIKPPTRDATCTQIIQEIIQFLGFTDFQEDAENRLEEWVFGRVCTGDCESKVRRDIVPLLKQWKVVLPAAYKLERVFNSLWAAASEKVYDTIAKQLDEKIKTQFDDFIASPKDSRKSDLFSIKTEPRKSTPETIKKWIEKYHLLKKIDLSKINLKTISESLASDYARYAKDYDVKTLRKFRPEKRYSLIACFIVKNHKRILDQIVPMDHNFLSSILRTIKKKYDEIYLDKSKKESQARLVLRRYAKKSIADIESQGQITIDDVENISEIKKAIGITEDLINHEDRGMLELALNRYSLLRSTTQPSWSCL